MDPIIMSKDGKADRVVRTPAQRVQATYEGFVETGPLPVADDAPDSSSDEGLALTPPALESHTIDTTSIPTE